MVAVSVWLVDAAVGFTVEESLADAATAIADLLDKRILGPINLTHLGLVVSVLYMGWQFLQGRIGAGAGEFALSLWCWPSSSTSQPDRVSSALSPVRSKPQQHRRRHHLPSAQRGVH